MNNIETNIEVEPTREAMPADQKIGIEELAGLVRKNRELLRECMVDAAGIGDLITNFWTSALLGIGDAWVREQAGVEWAVKAQEIGLLDELKKLVPDFDGGSAWVFLSVRPENSGVEAKYYEINPSGEGGDGRVVGDLSEIILAA